MASALKFGDLCGVPDAFKHRLTLDLYSSRVAERNDRELVGDVFFPDEGICFCVLNASRPAFEGFYSSARIFERLVPRKAGEPGARRVIVVGAVAADDVITDLFERFRSMLEAMVSEVCDGPLEFGWSMAGESGGAIDGLLDRLASDGSSPRFAKPEIDESAIASAELLSDNFARTQLREVSESGGFVREVDVLSRRGEFKEQLETRLDELVAADLLSQEKIIQCRRTSAPLIRIPAEGTLPDFEGATLRCASCNRPFRDELVSSGYAVTEHGRKMLNSSQWMMVWVTNRLVRAGISLESIVWNLEESGDEIDIVVDALDELWIIELKDREFGPGDAHPFNYRRVRYRANNALIVTTQTVSTDARRVFSELSPPPRRSVPVFVEGLECTDEKIREELRKLCARRALEAVRLASPAVGFDLEGIVRRIVPDAADPSEARQIASE
jgi:hypothetical protein